MFSVWGPVINNNKSKYVWWINIPRTEQLFYSRKKNYANNVGDVWRKRKQCHCDFNSESIFANKQMCIWIHIFKLQYDTMNPWYIAHYDDKVYFSFLLIEVCVTIVFSSCVVFPLSSLSMLHENAKNNEWITRPLPLSSIIIIIVCLAFPARWAEHGESHRVSVVITAVFKILDHVRSRRYRSEKTCLAETQRLKLKRAHNPAEPRRWNIHVNWNQIPRPFPPPPPSLFSDTFPVVLPGES